MGDRVGLASDDNEVITHPFEILQMAFLLFDRSVHAVLARLLNRFYQGTYWLLLDTAEKNVPKRIT